MYQIVETETDFVIYENGKELFKVSKSCNTYDDVIKFITMLGGKVDEVERICK